MLQFFLAKANVSGNVYNVSWSDGNLLAETLSGSLRRSASWSDGDLSGETFACSLRRSASFSDGNLLSESLTASLIRSASWSDGCSITDAYSGALRRSASFTDGVLTTDAFTGNLRRSVTLTDGGLLSESFACGVRYTAICTDTQTVTDAYAAALRRFATISDGGLAAESLTANLRRSASFSDGPQITDAFAAGVQYTAAFTDQQINDDGALWTPAYLPTKPVYWIEVDQLALSAGSSISSIPDLSGHSVSTTASGSSQPTYQIGVNSLGVARFDAADDFMTIDASGFPTGNSSRASYSLVTSRSSTARSFILSYGSNNGNPTDGAQKWDHEFNGWTSPLNQHFIIHLWDDGQATANAVIASGDTRILAGRYPGPTSNSIVLEVDGTVQATMQPTGTAYDNLTLNTTADNGRLGTRLSTPNFAAMDLSTFILLGYNPTDADHNRIVGYLAWKAGKQADLPSDHPYRNAAPRVGAGWVCEPRYSASFTDGISARDAFTAGAALFGSFTDTQLAADSFAANFTAHATWTDSELAGDAWEAIYAPKYIAVESAAWNFYASGSLAFTIYVSQSLASVLYQSASVVSTDDANAASAESNFYQPGTAAWRLVQ